MKYVNADHVFPEALIREIQKYIQDGLVYVPTPKSLHKKWGGEEPCPIDFGRCGYGYYLYDMAGALLELGLKQREHFIEGYESVRKLPLNYVRDVECFFVMFMIENGCHHTTNPEETNNLISEQPFALAYLREFLQQSSFLFRKIEPVSMDCSAAAPPE